MHLSCRHLIAVQEYLGRPVSDLHSICASRWRKDSLKAQSSLVMDFPQCANTMTNQDVATDRSMAPLTSAEKFNAVSPLLHRLQVLLTECGTTVFEHRSSVLQHLVGMWEKGETTAIGGKQSSRVGAISTKPDDDANGHTDHSYASTTRSTSRPSCKLFLPRIVVRGRPRRSLCWLNFNSKRVAKDSSKRPVKGTIRRPVKHLNTVSDVSNTV